MNVFEIRTTSKSETGVRRAKVWGYTAFMHVPDSIYMVGTPVPRRFASATGQVGGKQSGV